jgi:acetoacetate decarboxylase
MKLDPTRHYRMPLIMGPLFDKTDCPSFLYPEADVLAYQYLTDEGAIEALLPESFWPGKEPIVTVFFSEYNGLEFMAGGGYRTATYQVGASYEGEEDEIEGDFILVMFENQTWPILGGREDLGVPKLHADISPIRLLGDGHVRVDASMWGHHLFHLDVFGLRSQSALVRTVASRRINARPWLGYKYIPSLDGPPDADYATLTQNDTKLKKLWIGKTASVHIGHAGAEDIGYARPLLDALDSLAVRKPVQCLRFQGSSLLRYDRSRRLR